MNEAPILAEQPSENNRGRANVSRRDQALAARAAAALPVFGRIAVFAVYAYMHRGRGGVESSRQIVLSLDELRQMDLYFESQWHRQPTPAEFQAMVEDKVRRRSSIAKLWPWASIRTTPS